MTYFLSYIVFIIFTIFKLYYGQVEIRRDVTQLSDEEKDNILDALYKMKDSKSKWDSSYSAFDYYAVVHRYAFLYTAPPESAQGHNRWS